MPRNHTQLLIDIIGNQTMVIHEIQRELSKVSKWGMSNTELSMKLRRRKEFEIVGETSTQIHNRMKSGYKLYRVKKQYRSDLNAL